MKPLAAPIDASARTRALIRALGGYRVAHLRRSLAEIAITVIPFVLAWALLWYCVSQGYWIGLALVIPAAGLLVRMFMIMHDCSHGSFFRSRRTNDWVGRAIGVLTLTPFDFWRHTHELHHANSGNLDRPRVGGIDTLTVREYRALTPLQRLRYRAYRHPLVLFGLGPAYIFLLDNRLPVGFMRAGAMPWLSTMATNLAIAAVTAAMIWLVGVVPFLLVQLPIMLLATSIGVWLFYVQHQFEETFWARDEEWNVRVAGLHGSSHYDLPAVLRWFTANIGVHHVHHLCSRIPCYRLPEVLREHPELRDIGRLTLGQSLVLVRLMLWDEDQRRLVSFKQARPALDARD
ncbi:fatty acid desaturase [Halotalea alkalilenta]|uniref:fatty acid desaturase n=1 Tax=Halotalea alkalilenta TaxID=376489 RepID=UPI0004823475|nr:fatty acid desaturase [Halotalea alkalilenta]